MIARFSKNRKKARAILNNLSPEKARVFREAYRVLKLGGRLAVADFGATATLPDEVRGNWAACTGCMAGASQISQLEEMLRQAGVVEIKIVPKHASRSFIENSLLDSRSKTTSFPQQSRA